jgi:hypothetical protein
VASVSCALLAALAVASLSGESASRSLRISSSGFLIGEDAEPLPQTLVLGPRRLQLPLQLSGFMLPSGPLGGIVEDAP